MRPLIALFLLCAAAESEALAETPDCGGPITIGFLPPGSFIGKGSDIAFDLLANLTMRTGCQFRVQEMPRARVWKQLKAGSLDMAISGIPAPERREFSWFVSYVTMKEVAVFRPDIVRETDSDGILNNDAISVGITRGRWYNPAIDSLLRRIRARRPERISEVSEQPLLLKMLQSNRVQLVFMEKPVYLSACRDSGNGSLVSIDIAPDEIPESHSIVLSKTRFGIAEAEKWQQVMTGLLADGTVSKIFQRHLSKEELDGLTVLPQAALK